MSSVIQHRWVGWFSREASERYGYNIHRRLTDGIAVAVTCVTCENRDDQWVDNNYCWPDRECIGPIELNPIEIHSAIEHIMVKRLHGVPGQDSPIDEGIAMPVNMLTIKPLNIHHDALIDYCEVCVDKLMRSMLLRKHHYMRSATQPIEIVRDDLDCDIPLIIDQPVPKAESATNARDIAGTDADCEQW